MLPNVIKEILRMVIGVADMVSSTIYTYSLE